LWICNHWQGCPSSFLNFPKYRRRGLTLDMWKFFHSSLKQQREISCGPGVMGVPRHKTVDSMHMHWLWAAGQHGAGPVLPKEARGHWFCLEHHLESPSLSGFYLPLVCFTLRPGLKLAEQWRVTDLKSVSNHQLQIFFPTSVVCATFKIRTL
jgi:hypothetical protein